jgi:hypothetical protein
MAVWPTLVLWSATMLRDTLGSLAVVAVWWGLGRARELGWLRTSLTVLAALAIALSLRPYLGGGIALAALAWAAYPLVRRHARPVLAVAGASLVVLVGALLVIQPRQLDFAIHELLYRQTVSRMETLGKLYSDEPPPNQDQPIRPGVVVAVGDPRNGSLLTGIVQEFQGPTTVRIAFTDETVREVPVGDVELIQSVQIPPLQLAQRLGPDLLDFLAGLSTTSEPSSPVWIATALAWDALLISAALATVRLRVGPQEWLFPLCIVGVTVLALIAVPGAPGNGDRHRATQTVPLLLVLASGLLWSRAGAKQQSPVSTSPHQQTASQVPQILPG